MTACQKCNNLPDLGEAQLHRYKWERDLHQHHCPVAQPRYKQQQKSGQKPYSPVNKVIRENAGGKKKLWLKVADTDIAT